MRPLLHFHLEPLPNDEKWMEEAGEIGMTLRTWCWECSGRDELEELDLARQISSLKRCLKTKLSFVQNQWQDHTSNSTRRTSMILGYLDDRAVGELRFRNTVKPNRRCPTALYTNQVPAQFYFFIQSPVPRLAYFSAKKGGIGRYFESIFLSMANMIDIFWHGDCTFCYQVAQFVSIKNCSHGNISQLKDVSKWNISSGIAYLGWLFIITCRLKWRYN